MSSEKDKSNSTNNDPSSPEAQPKRTHGGRRKGSGRKPLPPHLKKARRKYFEQRNKQIRLKRELIHDLETWGEDHGIKRTSYSDIIGLAMDIVKKNEGPFDVDRRHNSEEDFNSDTSDGSYSENETRLMKRARNASNARSSRFKIEDPKDFGITFDLRSSSIEDVDQIPEDDSLSTLNRQLLAGILRMRREMVLLMEKKANKEE
jgi:hypothetical protein